jgi:hypothetical protein
MLTHDSNGEAYGVVCLLANFEAQLKPLEVLAELVIMEGPTKAGSFVVEGLAHAADNIIDEFTVLRRALNNQLEQGEITGSRRRERKGGAQ